MSGEEKLKELRTKRASYKSAITRVETFLNDRSLDKSLEMLEARKERLVSAFSQYEETQCNIQVLDEKDNEEVSIIENKYLKLLCVINKLIKDNTVQVSSSSNSKLPAIDLFIFSGKDFTQYKPFIELFQALIHNNRSLSDVQRLFYLRKYLSDEALSVIVNLPLVNDSYEKALELLNKRFDNKSRLISNHVGLLLDLPELSKGTAESLRSFISHIQQHLHALKNLEQPIEQWDMILISVLTRKLDQYTLRAYQLDRDCQELPTVSGFISFLEQRAIALEDSSVTKSQNKTFNKTSNKIVNIALSQNCKYCDVSPHKLYACPKFKLASVNQRQSFVTDNNLCMVCMKAHGGKCRLTFKCKKCRRLHNSLLCLEQDGEQPIQQNSVVNRPVHNSDENHSSIANICSNVLSNAVLIPTVKVKVYDNSGNYLIVKGMFDSGSQANFVSSSLIKKLGLSPSTQQTNIISIGNKNNNINKYVNLNINSCINNNVNFKIKCHVVDSITTQLPQNHIQISNFVLPKGVTLSDDEFNVPSNIDLLLNSEIYFNSLLDGNIKLMCGAVLQNTVFGYVVGGKMPSCNTNSYVTNKLVIGDSNKLENVMQQFWLSEELPQVSAPEKCSYEFQKAEQIFKNSVKLEHNTFHVDMPLASPIEELGLGDSFSAALQRFLSLEKKFKNNSKYLLKYKEFIDEYLALGHAREVDISLYDIDKGPVYFLAHHAVINEHSKTTKLRVVFNGSMNSKNKISLNSVMLNGPTVQSELFDVLLLFRSFIYTLMCDIQKMFRQVKINEHHKCLQNILWREDPSEPISCLQLQTLTYGLKASTFLATRCLIELVNCYGDEYPLASEALLKHTYVDDVIYGSNDEIQLTEIKNQLINLLQKGGFILHKWCSNSGHILNDIDDKYKYFADEVELSEDHTVKTLGLKYNITSDTLTYKCPESNEEVLNTKRKILSFISKMFDPLGLIGPIIVVGKLFIQELWKLKIDWDTLLPHQQLENWNTFLNKLHKMGTITAPRGVAFTNIVKAELVGYSDSSFKAFGACLYLRLIDQNGKIAVNLLCSKSRVAPLNKVLTIPKLELNSALLLSQLTSKVKETLQDRFNLKVYLYTDSQIVLSWINSEKIKTDKYVNSRVSQILTLTNGMQWSYVKSSENPADLLSRGCDPQKLQGNTLWWHGPQYLFNKNFVHAAFKNEFKITNKENHNSTEPCLNANLCTKENTFLEIFEKFSDLNKLVRVIAYIQRFKNNISKSREKLGGALSPKELENALTFIIATVQSKYFQDEKQAIITNKLVKNNMAALYPFLDQNGIIRVGGRLQNAKNISYNKMHPIILPKSCHVTYLIINREHLRLLHAGAKLVLSSLMQRYWLISGIRTVKKVLHRCVKCARLKAKVATQLMGSLPPERIMASRAFQFVGVDFCGHFNMKVARIRKPLITKAYIALFVCFTTKALHLEVVSDLTTETFLACLKRFISRKGMPTTIYCDNGKTFVGTANHLHKAYSSVKHKQDVESFCSTNFIKFKFIPGYSPEFGGLWEAGVKSVKTHFKRVVGDLALTFEELYTVVTQIEGVLNSRPLLPMSQDVSDMTYLTPGHFLIGAPITSFPETDLTNVKVNRLKFWNICTKISQDFWKAWSKDYLCQLQNRPKWKYPTDNLKEGDLVIVKYDHMTPLQWPMARIVKTVAGCDGKVRVVELKFANSDKIFCRSIKKVCPLPIND